MVRNKRRDIFERCREVPASRVAQKLGMVMVRSAGRTWCCCPFHGERNASLLFDEQGRFHCFGCGMDGDAVDFYASVHNVRPKEAARRILMMEGEDL